MHKKNNVATSYHAAKAVRVKKAILLLQHIFVMSMCSYLKNAGLFKY